MRGDPLPTGRPAGGWFDHSGAHQRRAIRRGVSPHDGAMPVFSPHQDAALKAVGAWLKAKPGRNNTPPVFRLFGYAGTGKTTLAKHIAAGVDGKVLFAAFTGEAASVMRQKGCTGASTIHSLIYRARETAEETPSFDLWHDSPAAKARLIVIDECSMVDAELGRDLLSFGAPVLVLGDPNESRSDRKSTRLNSSHIPL